MSISESLKDIHTAQTQGVRDGSRHVLIKIEGKRHRSRGINALDAKK